MRRTHVWMLVLVAQLVGFCLSSFLQGSNLTLFQTMSMLLGRYQPSYPGKLPGPKPLDKKHVSHDLHAGGEGSYHAEECVGQPLGIQECMFMLKQQVSWKEIVTLDTSEQRNAKVHVDVMDDAQFRAIFDS
mmetsp:Transcript_3787/g.13536  ORF Transcript_3787/g.13536 Transcript_3787/m.13536 type:complete len:131 (+) Transcript_3787:121-513(+)